MKRIWHPYWAWEDFQGGMWRKLYRPEEPDALREAAEFTGDAELYGRWMLEAIKEYPNAAEHNLTDPSLNKRAWIGHAACCLAKGLPEYIVRKAWATLSQEQKDKANAKADVALKSWQRIAKGKYDRQGDFDF